MTPGRPNIKSRRLSPASEWSTQLLVQKFAACPKHTVQPITSATSATSAFQPRVEGKPATLAKVGLSPHCLRCLKRASARNSGLRALEENGCHLPAASKKNNFWLRRKAALCRQQRHSDCRAPHTSRVAPPKKQAQTRIVLARVLLKPSTTA